MKKRYCSLKNHIRNPLKPVRKSKKPFNTYARTIVNGNLRKHR